MRGIGRQRMRMSEMVLNADCANLRWRWSARREENVRYQHIDVPPSKGVDLALSLHRFVPISLHRYTCTYRDNLANEEERDAS